ncbi:DUF397 domain-containing protein [Actinosynnema pretiosum subsp. pretiosum]|uniref:DUF397 domain-containing protein n=2 Tax=Actinosynnema TaxID=40566 RepID=C6WHI0_ACTMD|nr:DUF397 domain-containing protein [Actinosynnema mirum]ACU39929.1 protein of unknown function DUF397 [Actinosynnema mirum DSM 43827]AXX33443.1 hypothetical protein APASM_6078 [Actinosynnema pretiosum subsp. pretiosum]QUF02750.1 DUF397 domain-containing protein [Actinosynnema pretiosum subsp. pretiosum]
MQETGLPGAPWRKSSYSGNGPSCVEIAPVNNAIATRDSKNPTGPVLLFPEVSWSTFLRSLR